MKIGLLGKGKTGQKIIELADERADINLIVFDSQNKATLEALQELDMVISFLAGPVFMDYIPMLLDAKVPVISGSTGMNLPDDLNAQLIKNNVPWVMASNFALGMSMAFHTLRVFAQAKSIFKNYEFHLHEIHHTQKLDAPSGTAKSWDLWLGHECKITYAREGDVVGTHTVELITPFEEMSFTHKSKDRKIFAQGALWCVDYVKKQKLKTGLHLFETITRQLIEKELQNGE